MLSDFEMRIVRQESCGVKFNSIIADRVGELWYDTPRHPQISPEQALKMPIEVDRKVDVDWKEMGILRDHVVKPGDRVVECGCHHGLTTIMLASWVGQSGFVQAFDAVLLNAAIARRNLELNGISNASVYCAAIGGTRQIVNYYNESNVIVKAGAAVNRFSTIMITLEDAISERTDVLKLDVEGCELEILESSKSLLRRIPRVAIELHTDLLPPNGVGRVMKTLANRPLYVLWENGTFERYTGQNITERVHLFSFGD
jgi:FkbM family methyltransferase